MAYIITDMPQARMSKVVDGNIATALLLEG